MQYPVVAGGGGVIWLLIAHGATEMQQAVLGQDGGVGEPAGRVSILMAARHGVEKGGITRGYPGIGNEAGGVRGGAEGIAVFKTGAEDAGLGAPIGFAENARRLAASNRGNVNVTVAS